MSEQYNYTVSVIICTYNRSQLLYDALLSFSEQEGLCAIAYELLVVDNNSTDDTEAVVRGFTNKVLVRYIKEPELGLSNARNRGIREARGELTAFVDDDVLFGKEWLIHLVRGAERWPNAAVFGGKAVAKWEVNKPTWFLDDGRFHMRGMIAHFEPAQGEGILTKVLPYGCNMAVRSSIFHKYGGFDPHLGRVGGTLLSGEEWDFFWRLLNGGEIMVYLPSAMVFHRVTGTRGQKEYYSRWMKSSGETQAVLHGKSLHARQQPMFLNCTLSKWRDVSLAIGAWLCALVSLRWHRLFGPRLNMIGFVSYFFARQSRVKKR